MTDPDVSLNAINEREAFEAWLDSEFPSGCISDMERGWLARAALASAAQPSARRWPPVTGLGRDAGHPRAVMVYLAAEPTDDEMRALHDAVGGEAAAAPKAAPAPAAVAPASEAPEGWRNKFAEAVYADLEAADNQDVSLEEYPARILKVLDSLVGPRHPTVIHWRNDAIQACIAIAHKYCRDPESFQYLKQDLRALIFAAPKAAPAPAAVAEPVAWLHDDPQRYDVIHAEVKDLLVKSRDAAGHLHRPLDKSAHYTIPLYTAPAPAAQWDACDAKHIAALTEIVRMPNAEYVADAHNAAVKYLRARGAQGESNA